MPTLSPLISLDDGVWSCLVKAFLGLVFLRPGICFVKLMLCVVLICDVFDA